MKQNKGSEKKKWLWVLVLIIVLGLGYVIYNPEVLPRNLAYQVYLMKEKIGSGEKYSEIDYDEKTHYSTRSKFHMMPAKEGGTVQDNTIALSSKRPLSKQEMIDIANENNATLAYWYGGEDGSFSPSFGIQLKKRHSESELKDICDKLEKDERIRYASPDYFDNRHTELFFSPNDKEIAGGKNNKYLEQINAYELWDYYDQMSYVNLGVIDGNFDDKHKDLHFKGFINKPVSGPFSWLLGERKNHGTNVAGIPSAMFNNNLGVAGIVPKTNLYGDVLDGDDFDLKNGVHRLVLGYEVKAINFSADTPRYLKDRPDLRADFYSHLSWLASQKEFVIVKAAGNSREDAMKSAVFAESEELRDRIIVVGGVGSSLDMWGKK